MTASRESARRDLPRLHVVTNDAVLADTRFRERAGALLERGGSAVALHIRGHGTSGRLLAEQAAHCAAVARRAGAALFVNDRVDVALACAADGVQLGTRSLPVGDVRRLLGPDRWIGASVHSLEEAERAAREGADFLVAGTLYSSASHPGRPPSGAAWLKDLTRIGLPVIGIGGIDPSRVAEVREAGGHGVAVIRGIWEADSVEAALAAYLERL